MKEGAGRLQRLHALRCRMADAASMERARIAQEVRHVGETIVSLRASSAAVLQDAEHHWREQQAQLLIAATQNDHLLRCKEQLETAEHASVQAERAAIQAREQIGRMLARREAELLTEQSRREQARMDDLFATNLLRTAIAMNF